MKLALHIALFTFLIGPAAATLTTPVAWETVYHGGIRFDVDLEVVRATTTMDQVIDSQAELDAFYEMLYKPSPSVDFTNTVVLAAVSPSDWTDGYFGIRRIDAVHAGGFRDLTVSITVCSSGLMFCVPPQAGAHLVAVERIPGLVVFSSYQPYGPGVPLGADRIE